ncbi:MAG TPA: ThuA domain-containing protein [Verrucomicrobiae bacterium]
MNTKHTCMGAGRGRTHCLLLVYGLMMSGLAFGAAGAEPAKGPAARVLVFSKTLGFRHSNIPLGVSAVRQLGTDNGFVVDATEDSSVFTAENLAKYKAVVFLSVTGDVLDEPQEQALSNFVLGGGGFAGIHGALFGPSACEDKWAWYGELCCVSFKNHSAVVPAAVDIEDHNHPSTAGLPARWTRTDEWYNYDGTPRGRAHVLASIDESTYKGGTVGEDHPIAWCKVMGKGLMWYTAMGHTDESFREPLFLKHVLGGIQFAAGMKKGDTSANQKSARRATE